VQIAQIASFTRIPACASLWSTIPASILSHIVTCVCAPHLLVVCSTSATDVCDRVAHRLLGNGGVADVTGDCDGIAAGLLDEGDDRPSVLYLGGRLEIETSAPFWAQAMAMPASMLELLPVTSASRPPRQPVPH
jgi:hypothetical protein